MIFVIDHSPEGCILVGLLSSAVDKFKIHLRISGDLRVRRVGGDHVAEVQGALAQLDLRPGPLPEHRRLVVGLLHLHSDRDLRGLLVQTIVAGNCLK